MMISQPQVVADVILTAVGAIGAVSAVGAVA
jgi:hypothetical protein